MTDVSRSTGTRTVDGEEARVATIARTHPTDDLWEACTTAERISRWFLPVTGDLRRGGRYQLEGDAAGTVEECDPPHRFVATWEFAGGTSRITVSLTAVGLLGLARHLDDPTARFDEAAFGASAEGRRFVAESGDAWCAAGVASGLDERAQRAAADRSIAFYAPADS
ncbi:SRPBCC family protein [Pseudonocardia petroleophila]|uniref:SRPBCC domain-containing protein n=1 Tax=Pseudonocardia petroleophila TaxID=37331 RepID=A0A7G7ME61_9PSEU|nr:SRPBCC domain-containing protein [Pseudonocardia petroleophila]QNG51072.1 SRPBCC domain-containing protein [Pseudonocardia petroleophila]